MADVWDEDGDEAAGGGDDNHEDEEGDDDNENEDPGEEEQEEEDDEDGEEEGEEEDILDMEQEAPVQHDALLMRFCPHDSSMLYPQENKRERMLQYACRLCRYTEAAPNAPLVYRNERKKEVVRVTQQHGGVELLPCSSIGSYPLHWFDIRRALLTTPVALPNWDCADREIFCTLCRRPCRTTPPSPGPSRPTAPTAGTTRPSSFSRTPTRATRWPSSSCAATATTRYVPENTWVCFLQIWWPVMRSH
jgi:RNA polymerases M/15 Kd subunit